MDEDGRRIGLVVVKCCFPFRLSNHRTGEYVYQGANKVPQAGIPVEHFLQCQLQMLVTDLPRCDLVHYSSRCGTYVFQLQRDDHLCKLMLGVLQDINAAYLKPRVTPKSADRSPVNGNNKHTQFMEALIRSVKRAEQRRWEIPVSAFNPAQAHTYVDNPRHSVPLPQPVPGA